MLTNKLGNTVEVWRGGLALPYHWLEIPKYVIVSLKNTFSARNLGICCILPMPLLIQILGNFAGCLYGWTQYWIRSGFKKQFMECCEACKARPSNYSDQYYSISTSNDFNLKWKSSPFIFTHNSWLLVFSTFDGRGRVPVW